MAAVGTISKLVVTKLVGTLFGGLSWLKTGSRTAIHIVRVAARVLGPLGFVVEVETIGTQLFFWDAVLMVKGREKERRT